MHNFIILIATSFLIISCQNENGSSNTPIFSEERLSNAVIYEVNVRQFTEAGTFEAFQAYVPQLKALGVDIVWLMPIHPIGVLNRKGGLGSYYSISDYRGINPEFGDLEDFKALVQSIHEEGMFVILDWVAGHTAWDHPWVGQHPDWYIKDEAGNIIPPNPDWTDVAGLDFSNPNMLQALEDDMAYWVEEVGVDGYRCDAAYNISTAFWDKAIKRLQATKPVFMLAESDANHKGGHELITLFDTSYGWHTHHLLNQIAQGKQTASDLGKHLEDIQNTHDPNHAQMNFTTNHDENSWNGTVFERMGAAAEVMGVLSYAMPGMPLIYGGQEFGLDKRLAFFEKDFIEKKSHPFKDLYSKLNQIKKENTALNIGQQPGAFEWIKNSNVNLLTFKRSTETESLLFVGNLSDSVQIAELPFSGTYLDLLTGKEVTIVSGMSLQAWQCHLLIKQ